MTTRLFLGVLAISALSAPPAMAECKVREVRLQGTVSSAEPYTGSFRDACVNPEDCTSVDIQLTASRDDILVIQLRYCKDDQQSDGCSDWHMADTMTLFNARREAEVPPRSSFQWGNDTMELAIDSADVYFDTDTQIVMDEAIVPRECVEAGKVISVKTIADSVRDELNPYLGDIPEVNDARSIGQGMVYE